MKTLPYGRQFIEDDDIRAVVDVLKSDWLHDKRIVSQTQQNEALP